MNKNNDNITIIALCVFLLIVMFVDYTVGRQKAQARFEQCIKQHGKWTKSPNGYVCVIEEG